MQMYGSQTTEADVFGVEEPAGVLCSVTWENAGGATANDARTVVERALLNSALDLDLITASNLTYQ